MTLSRSRMVMAGFGVVLPQPLQYSELYRYWLAHAADPTDTVDLDEFVYLLGELDQVFMLHKLTPS